MSRQIIRGLLLVLCAAVFTPTQAYTVWNSKWPQPQTTFYVNIAGNNGLWNVAFEEALAAWAPSGFRYSVVRNYSDPCNSSDLRNGVRFHTSVCGSAFGSTTLAITRSYRTGTTTVETDIVFNANRSWGVYDTTYSSSKGFDFKRVAVHELGHALGLNHESERPAIMAPYVGNIIQPQADDLAGVRAVYTLQDDFGDTMSTAKSVKPNSSTPGVIDSGSDVDFFRIEFGSRGRLVVKTTGTTNTVGTLYSSAGSIIASNDNGCGSEVNFCLVKMLNAGTYYVKVDGYGTSAKGAYTFVSQYAVDDYGNTRAEAHAIAPNGTTSGRINSGTDVDFFKVTVSGWGYLSLKTTGTTNTVGSLYSSNGTLLVTNDNGCGGAPNFCIRRLVGPGTYYLKVDGYGQTVTGPYSLVSNFVQ